MPHENKFALRRINRRIKYPKVAPAASEIDKSSASSKNSPKATVEHEDGSKGVSKNKKRKRKGSKLLAKHDGELSAKINKVVDVKKKHQSQALPKATVKHEDGSEGVSQNKKRKISELLAKHDGGLAAKTNKVLDVEKEHQSLESKEKVEVDDDLAEKRKIVRGKKKATLVEPAASEIDKSSASSKNSPKATVKHEDESKGVSQNKKRRRKGSKLLAKHDGELSAKINKVVDVKKKHQSQALPKATVKHEDGSEGVSQNKKRKISELLAKHDGGLTAKTNKVFDVEKEHQSLESKEKVEVDDDLAEKRKIVRGKKKATLVAPAASEIDKSSTSSKNSPKATVKHEDGSKGVSKNKKRKRKGSKLLAKHDGELSAKINKVVDVKKKHQSQALPKATVKHEDGSEGVSQNKKRKISELLAKHDGGLAAKTNKVFDVEKEHQSLESKEKVEVDDDLAGKRKIVRGKKKATLKRPKICHTFDKLKGNTLSMK